jgi:hypothetical protein
MDFHLDTLLNLPRYQEYIYGKVKESTVKQISDNEIEYSLLKH